MLDDFGLLLTAATGEFAVERGVDEGEIPKNINLARFFIEMTGFPGEKAGCPVVSLRDPVFRKLFKSTLNNRLCSNLACVIDESSRGVKLKRAFEELPST